ncbi:MAG: ATP-binding cassette domain-containing protein [Candidatus Gracilibacteria bacterium]|nr:ATP-binding cassette domain-containing protein [Candidatus Gracilibacteria bacterium]
MFSFWERKSYEDIQVLDRFSLDVLPGEFVGIMGPNGSGKSTLMKILAGVYEPDEGEVEINGKLVAVLELGVGFHPELSARENILMYGLLLGLSESYLKSHMMEIIQFAELETFLDAPLKVFSSGMKARLAFAVVIQVDADVYLMDEILAVGDEGFQKKCFQYFEKLRKNGKTLLFVSHSRDAVEDLCDRFVEL